jgi:hypothetical protein
VRVLTSSVLVMEAIVLGLAIPVALVAGGQPTWYIWLLAGLALAAVLLPGLAKRPSFVAAGWILQAAVLLAGVLGMLIAGDDGQGWMLLVLGAIFAALWWAALHLGRRAEAIRAQQVPPAP